MAARWGSSLGLFSFKGIKVQVHWSFPLLILWVVFSSMAEGMDTTATLRQVLYILVLFCCVVLHEFGHALTALHFGIRTRNITLLPIGGVARLERMPEKPAQELFVAIAGPAVNVVIMLLIGLPMLLLDAPLFVQAGADGPLEPASLAAIVFIGNLGLAVFNLIPAFPMDGGRVVRALLAFRLGRVKATRLAVGLGRFIAFGFILLAIWQRQPMLGLIGLFVILGAGAERRLVEMQGALRAATVRDVMRTRFWTLPHDRTVQQASDELLAGGDHMLFITRDGAWEKLIAREELIAAMQDGRSAEPLSALQGTAPNAVHPSDDVNELLARLDQSGAAMLPVVDGGLLVGVLELDNLAEYIQLKGRREA